MISSVKQRRLTEGFIAQRSARAIQFPSEVQIRTEAQQNEAKIPSITSSTSPGSARSVTFMMPGNHESVMKRNEFREIQFSPFKAQ